ACVPITPKTGSLFHADSQRSAASAKSAGRRRSLYPLRPISGCRVDAGLHRAVRPRERQASEPAAALASLTVRSPGRSFGNRPFDAMLTERKEAPAARALRPDKAIGGDANDRFPSRAAVVEPTCFSEKQRGRCGGRVRDGLGSRRPRRPAPGIRRLEISP